MELRRLARSSSFEGAGHPGPAVRVFEGEVDSITIL
eukprot:COSAG05_NODE_14673_length_390_cov_1.233677_1_plen_35_part_10